MQSRPFVRLAAAAAAGILGLAGCSSLFYSSTECTDRAATASPSPLPDTAAGGSWVYQLQSAVPAELATSGFDIAVIDYSADGSAAGEYTPADLNAIRAGTGPDTVLAYFSVGEAEDYRYYFDPAWTGSLTGQPTADAPCWLGRTNPDWKGNYKVQYWSAAWQQIVLDYLDRIIAVGFDGVYLDIIDGYEYWADNRNGEDFTLTEREAADRMMNLVLTIADHARAVDPGFLVFPQNGAPILAYDDGGGLFPASAYLDTISGIGVEDLYYNETTLRDQIEIDYRIEFLTAIRNAGKTVAVVDYVDNGSESVGNAERIADFRARATADGFLPYAARKDRALDEINLAPGQP